MYCCAPKALYNHVGWGLLNHHLCVASTWIMRQQPQDNGAVRSPHTSYRWRGERVSQSSGWGLLGGHDWQGPVVRIWSGHRGYTPLFEKCHGIFNDSSENVPLYSLPSSNLNSPSFLSRQEKANQQPVRRRAANQYRIWLAANSICRNNKHTFGPHPLTVKTPCAKGSARACLDLSVCRNYCAGVRILLTVMLFCARSTVNRLHAVFMRLRCFVPLLTS